MEELIARRDMKGIIQLYRRGAVPFDIRTLKLAVGDAHDESSIDLILCITERDPVGVYQTPGVVDMLLASPRGWYAMQCLIPANAKAVLKNDLGRFIHLGSNWCWTLQYFPAAYNVRLYNFPGLMHCVIKYRCAMIFTTLMSDAVVRASNFADPLYRNAQAMHDIVSDGGERDIKRRTAFRMVLARLCFLALARADGALGRLVRADGDWAVVFSALAFV